MKIIQCVGQREPQKFLHRNLTWVEFLLSSWQKSCALELCRNNTSYLPMESHAWFMNNYVSQSKTKRGARVLALDDISEVFFQAYICHLYVEVFSSLSNSIIKSFPVVFHLMSQVFRRRNHYELEIKITICKATKELLLYWIMNCILCYEKFHFKYFLTITAFCIDFRQRRSFVEL